MSWIKEIKENLYEKLKQAAILAKNDAEISFDILPDFVIEVPRERSHGDFAGNLAMLLAKQAHMNPRKIGEILINHLDLSDTLAEKAEVAGAGFINFTMSAGWLNPGLTAILLEGEHYGDSNAGKGKKVQVEFVSANPTGELHMGNARGAAIGDSLASVMQAAGYEVEREFYVNDAGNQIEKFGLSLEARYLQELGENVPFPEDGYHGEDVQRTMHAFIKEFGDKYLNTASDLRREVFTRYALDKKITAIKAGLERFGVNYDVWFSEQSLHDSGAVSEVVEELADKGYIEEKEGALWFKADSFGAEKAEVLVRANGIPTYYAADIAYHKNKFERGFEQVINIWGADHHGHVARLKAGVDALGYDSKNLDVILMQLVRLFQGGEIMRMSKRAGTYVTLEELMDEVGVDAARFFFAMRSADSQMDFDLDLAKSESSDNPVYYVQYAHARICSILAQAEEQGIKLPNLKEIKFDLLKEESEDILIRKLLDLPR